LANLKTIFVAEDDANDVFLLTCALEEAALPWRLIVAEDGLKAIEMLKRYTKDGHGKPELSRLPDLVLLDINMPRVSGFDVLEWVRKQPRLEKLCVVMLSNSTRDHDMLHSGTLGANDYQSKPIGLTRYVTLVKALHARWLA
jgi:CheY-like chemotaxis protein